VDVQLSLRRPDLEYRVDSEPAQEFLAANL
jgi:hypothetical protein